MPDGSPEQIFFLYIWLYLPFSWGQKPANWGSWAKSSSPSTFINEALKGHSHSYVFIYYLGLLLSIAAESWQRLHGSVYWLFHDYDKNLKEVTEVRKHLLQLMISGDAVHYSGECIGATSSVVWKARASLLTLGRSGNRNEHWHSPGFLSPAPLTWLEPWDFETVPSTFTVGESLHSQIQLCVLDILNSIRWTMKSNQHILKA